MLASDLSAKLTKAIAENGDHEVLDENEDPINDIEYNEDADEAVFMLTT